MTDAALELAAQCWCDPETSSKEMDVELAKSFARRLDPILQQLAECQARENASHRSKYEKGVFNPVFDSPPEHTAEELK